MTPHLKFEKNKITDIYIYIYIYRDTSLELQSPDMRYPKRAHLQRESKVAMCTASPCGPHFHCYIFVVFLA